MAHRLLNEDDVDAVALAHVGPLVVGLPSTPETMEAAIDPMKRSTHNTLRSRHGRRASRRGQLSSASLTQLAEAALLMGHDATAEHLLQHALADRPGDAALHAIAERIAARLVTVLHAWPTSRHSSQSGPMTPNFSAVRPISWLRQDKPRQNDPFAGEALGKVTAADRSLLSGLRARQVHPMRRWQKSRQPFAKTLPAGRLGSPR